MVSFAIKCRHPKKSDNKGVYANENEYAQPYQGITTIPDDKYTQK